MRALIAVLLLVSSRTLFSQPQCEPRPEVRQVLEEKLATKKLAELKFAERVAYRRQTLEDLIAKYPTEVEPYRQLIKVTKEEDTDHFPGLAARFQKAAEQHPDDPMSLYAAGLALYNRNTPPQHSVFRKSHHPAKRLRLAPVGISQNLCAVYQASRCAKSGGSDHRFLCRMPFVDRPGRAESIESLWL
jgi:hypothetical protein